MAALNLVIGDKTGRSFSKKLEDNSALAGRKIGETIKGELVGISGYEFKITGGSNDAGFPMRHGINLAGKKKIYAGKGIGVNPKYKGNLMRKTVAGNTAYQKTSQLNLAVVKQGKTSLDEVFGKKETKTEEGKNEGNKTEAKAAESKPTEPKPEEKKEAKAEAEVKSK